MQIIPAIDLIGGECVRLIKGNYDKKTVYEKDPILMMQRFYKNGVKYAHIVDLDGARDPNKRQLPILKKIAEKFSDIKIECGGGIRSRKDVKSMLDVGINRVIIGSMCAKNPDEVKSFIREFGEEKIVLGLDVKLENGIPMMLTDAWYKTSDKTLYSLLDFYLDTAKHPIVLCTDIAKDGALKGTNTELYKKIKTKYPQILLIASGGVSTENDLAALADIPCEYAVVGKAIYENRIDLKTAVGKYNHV